jgi:endonuclease/exonuclease/phosphatase (EEP) superfamily protein YafD
MGVFLICLGVLLILATALPFVRRDDWWIRIFDFPRLQITLLLAVALAGYLALSEPDRVLEFAYIGALTLALVYQSYRMYPYTPLHGRQVQASRRATAESSASLLFANVLMTNRNADALRELIRLHDPDVVLAVETDDWWEAALRPLEDAYPVRVKQPQDNTYGMLLYSKLELRDADVKFLIEPDVPSIHARLVLRSGEQIELRCLHPRPPAPQESERSTERDAELLMVGRALKKLGRPAIVIGDLNDVAWSRTSDMFQRISGLLDPRIGRGFFPTFNAHWPLVRFPLDHVFHTRHFRLVDFRRLPPWGSDHFAVYVKLSFEPDAKHEQEKPQATPEEKREAQEKIAEARVGTSAGVE